MRIFTFVQFPIPWEVLMNGAWSTAKFYERLLLGRKADSQPLWSAVTGSDFRGGESIRSWRWGSVLLFVQRFRALKNTLDNVRFSTIKFGGPLFLGPSHFSRFFAVAGGLAGTCK